MRVIDVREPREFYGDLGHLPGAQLVPLASVPEAMCGWDPSEPILVVCRSGARAGRACGLLTANGFSDVRNLTGGMLAWHARGGDACHVRHKEAASCSSWV